VKGGASMLSEELGKVVSSDSENVLFRVHGAVVAGILEKITPFFTTEVFTTEVFSVQYE
jgi:hypothetical protein